MFDEEKACRELMAELIDIRTKVDEVTHQVIEAHARAHDVDKSEIVRKVLHDWGKKEVHVATLVTRLTRSEGGAKS
jgi:DNA-binding FrmR family transcriptional regulator